MMEQTTTLIVNADDFGLSEGINRGILAAHQNGIVRSASIMPNGPAFEDAVDLARQDPTLDIGIHLSLLRESSVAPAADLRDMVDGDRHLPESYPVFTRQLLSKHFTTAQVQTEIRAQIERVLEAGIDPSHIDSHQHVHMLPSVFEIVLNLAPEYGIPAVRVPLESGGQGNGGLFARLAQALFLPGIERGRTRQVEAAGLHAAGSFWGLRMAGRIDETALLSILENLRSGVNELMCHPGIGDTATAERYPGYSWDHELAALQSESVRRFIEERSIRLATFRDAWN